MPSSKRSDPQPAELAVVLRRYRAAGECRELGIAHVPASGILVEQLEDGSFRLAADQAAPLFELAPAPPQPAPESAPADPPSSPVVPSPSEEAS